MKESMRNVMGKGLTALYRQLKLATACIVCPSSDIVYKHCHSTHGDGGQAVKTCVMGDG
jgi:hypothetical protein